MSKKNWLQVSVLVVLAAVYVFYFTDWFRPKLIEIRSVSRMNRLLMRQHQQNDGPAAQPVLFGLNTHYKLTELKVYRLDAWQTNHNILPVWHLVTPSNSIPIKEFYYSQYIHGMQPAIPGTHAEKLDPDVTYHLILVAGKFRGEHDFTTKLAGVN